MKFHNNLFINLEMKHAGQKRHSHYVFIEMVWRLPQTVSSSRRL